MNSYIHPGPEAQRVFDHWDIRLQCTACGLTSRIGDLVGARMRDFDHLCGRKYLEAIGCAMRGNVRCLCGKEDFERV